MIPEKDEWVSLALTLGHAMHTVGAFPNQYFWCEKCGAHTTSRVRVLKERCRNSMGNKHAAEMLASGRDPYRGTALATSTRRLTMEDIGCALDGTDPCTGDAPYSFDLHPGGDA